MVEKLLASYISGHGVVKLGDNCSTHIRRRGSCCRDLQRHQLSSSHTYTQPCRRQDQLNQQWPIELAVWEFRSCQRSAVPHCHEPTRNLT